MRQKNLGMMISAAFVAGLFGGLLSNYFITGDSAFAQKTPHIPKSISAEEFRLVDADGKTRVILHTVTVETYRNRLDGKSQTSKNNINIDDLPGSHLTFLDENGIESASLGISLGSGASLHLMGDDHSGSTSLSGSRLFLASGESMVTLDADKTGTGLKMNAHGEDYNSLVFLEASTGKIDESFKKLAKIDPPRRVNFFISSYPSKGETKTGGVELFLSQDGDPTLRLDDKEGNLRAELGRSQLVVPRTGTEETRSVSSLVLFGPDGKILWSAP